MSTTRDEFGLDTKRLLAQRAAQICSNPHCEVSTSGPQTDPTKALNLGVAAHITAASEGGERYDPVLTEEKRSSSDNGIWLCQNCAKKIDNDPIAYPVETIRAWKTIRENNAKVSIGRMMPAPVETEADRKKKYLEEWVGRDVMQVYVRTGRDAAMLGTRATAGFQVRVIEVTSFYVMVRGQGWDKAQTITFKNLELGYDERMKCPELLRYDM